MPTQNKFNQSEYWIQRHIEFKDDPRSVGNLASTLQENFNGEKALQDYIGVAARLLKKKCSSVLDLGCGYGRVSRCFTGQGFAYTGYDVSNTAIEEARARNDQATFQLVDLLHWHPSEKFDLVCLLYVLVHFVRDEDWSKFLNAALSSVKGGGYLMLADDFPTAERRSARHYVARPFDEYIPLLEASGFVIDEAVSREVAQLVPGNSNIRYMRFAKLSS
jgi:SAM-dependent methyltransferase